MIDRKDRKNQFDDAVEALKREELAQREKSALTVKTIAGNSRTRVIEDKNGRKREIRIAEKRKSFPVYVPTSLYGQFVKITEAYGVSNNSVICQLIRDYVEQKKWILEDNK